MDAGLHRALTEVRLFSLWRRSPRMHRRVIRDDGDRAGAGDDWPKISFGTRSESCGHDLSSYVIEAEGWSEGIGYESIDSSGAPLEPTYELRSIHLPLV